MSKQGARYEDFVAKLQAAILASESLTHQKNISVELNKKIKDNAGVVREFDVYWEYEFGGLTHKVAIECKDHASKVSVEKIDAFVGKIRDIPDIKPVFATRLGYQSGAIKKAKQNRIDLLIIREQNDSDWIDENGMPLIRKVELHACAIHSAVIDSVKTYLDKQWMEIYAKEDIETIGNFSALNNEIFIEDFSSMEKYSFYDLAKKLTAPDGKAHGTFKTHRIFDNAFIHQGGKIFKLRAYEIIYSIPEPDNYIHEIDFKDALIGVVEYLEARKKSIVFKNGSIRKEKTPDKSS